ncbi:hypothetical protein HZS_6433 [Henneguya salminicola]|nr:hypothetical protein HZS_6433 [Henneguya salminicola]
MDAFGDVKIIFARKRPQQGIIPGSILIIIYRWYTKENQSDIDFELGRSISTKATIISDGWAAYINISSIPGYRYTHRSVNYS